ncbi:MAG TPA: 2-C-methyl-D-erythritol 4-phosphate cytidylyltransferase, partial [Caulobacteraceae bacterium]|nr:2-C-methyl-D-erythritol 4-phosphate cytidylyltransferase [Caulobacteraceae bacterium]
MRFCGVIVAAGSGVRAGQGAKKQWRRLGGYAVVRWSAEALLSAGAAPLVVVVSQGDEDVAADALAGLSGWTLVRGGETRTQSVQAGLDALSDAPDEAAVLIHDAARPFVNARHVAVLVEALEEADGALPALPVSDTLKREGDGATVPRDGLRRAQTPQAFRLGPLRRAFATWPVQE